MEVTSFNHELLFHIHALTNKKMIKNLVSRKSENQDQLSKWHKMILKKKILTLTYFWGSKI